MNKSILPIIFIFVFCNLCFSQAKTKKLFFFPNSRDKECSLSFLVVGHFEIEDGVKNYYGSAASGIDGPMSISKEFSEDWKLLKFMVDYSIDYDEINRSISYIKEYTEKYGKKSDKDICDFELVDTTTVFILPNGKRLLPGTKEFSYNLRLNHPYIAYRDQLEKERDEYEELKKQVEEIIENDDKIHHKLKKIHERH